MTNDRARDASLRVGGGVYRASGRVAHSGEPAVAETELYVKPVGVFYARHAPRAAVPHVEAVCEQAVMAVCLVAFFGAAQRRAFRAHVELAARCYRRESDGTAVLHAEHRHALVLETFHRAVIAAVYAMAQPALGTPNRSTMPGSIPMEAVTGSRSPCPRKPQFR